MRRSSVAHLALVATVISACSLAGGCGSIKPESVGASPWTPAPHRIPVPPGFPVPAGAAPLPMPDDDPGLIGLWATGARGSGAYDFYVNALPAAGYRIMAAYPGGDFAMIRFGLANGATWQVVTRAGPEGSVAIEVRLDRP